MYEIVIEADSESTVEQTLDHLSNSGIDTDHDDVTVREVSEDA